MLSAKHVKAAWPHSWQDAAKKLMDCAVVSRVDADEAANLKKARPWFVSGGGL